MKKDIGKRTYKEMYLITKEERSILEKCTTNLNQNPKTDLLSKMKNVEKTTQTDETNTETSSEATPTSNQNSSISEEVSSISRPSQSSSQSLNDSKLSENLMVYGGEIIETPKKKDAKIVSPTKEKSPKSDQELGKLLDSSQLTMKRRRKKQTPRAKTIYTRWK